MKFPETIDKYDYGEIAYETNASSWGEYHKYYLTSEVQDWFKQCMEDCPKLMTKDNRYNKYFYEHFVIWFQKWFSQFKEKADS